jgi:chemotaxis protein methyltransferase WspC
MIVPRVQALLRQRMGLDAASIGAAAIERAVRERMSACPGQDPQIYWERLCASEVELQELIEAVVVPETWFFRDREAFSALRNMADAQLNNGPAGRILRVLSLPCATGEEPYSMAMALLDTGIPASRLQIDAVDISLRAIAYAERAVYGKNSFRSTDLGFRERHFTRVEQSYQLSDAVRQPVHFRQANLFASGAFPEEHVYDFIFCRNVLIYFDRAGQKLAVRLLGRLLAPGGTLFVGPSESPLLLDLGYASAKIPLAFAFRRATVVPAATNPAAAAVNARPLHSLSSRPLGRQRVLESGAIARPAVATPKLPQQRALVTDPMPMSQINPESLLEEAQRLADQGKVAEAMLICQRILNDGRPSARAFYLLGLLHDTTNEPAQASAHYRKALYLDPTHREAMLHLAEALIREGATAEAQRLFDRAGRISANGGARNE